MDWNEEKKKNNGILDASMVKSGDVIRFIEKPYQNNKGNNVYWNCKVELPDGSHKIGSIFGQSGDKMAEVWGADTDLWEGKMCEVSIQQNRDGKEYILLIPLAEDAVAKPSEPDRVKEEDLPF